MGADDRHYDVTHRLLETLREKSIARSANDIEVPDLSSPDLLLTGGADYNDMCSGCHLRPGITETDLSIGLYPRPPNLVSTQEIEQGSAENNEAAKRNFWIIKHGIKASGMPAWGPTHGDERIWAMVAFLDRLPSLSVNQYQILTTRDGNNGGDHH